MVLYPVADALHLVHGPVGCAVYTWDIRGALSSGPQLHRNSFTTDLREKDVIFGGEKKLQQALTELIDANAPKAAFVYSTCIVGIIGDDVETNLQTGGEGEGHPGSSGSFRGFQRDQKGRLQGRLFGPRKAHRGGRHCASIGKYSLNILGEFNIGGEAWIIQDYYKRMGIQVVSVMTGNGRVEEIRRSHGASLNVVQCSGSMIHLAKMMEEKYGIPYIRVSYFGIEDMSDALYNVGQHFDNQEIMERTRKIVRDEVSRIQPELKRFRESLEGKKAAIYVGGAFKAFSLIKALRHLGMDVVLAGSQTGDEEDYELLKKMCDEGAVIVDDANPLELSKYMVEKKADLFIGGVKERPIAYKMGVGFSHVQRSG